MVFVPLAGTARINDVELGTVSKQIQDRLLLRNISLDRISSVVIRNKSQYEYFLQRKHMLKHLQLESYRVLKQTDQGGIGWEYADIKGIKPSLL